MSATAWMVAGTVAFTGAVLAISRITGVNAGWAFFLGCLGSVLVGLRWERRTQKRAEGLYFLAVFASTWILLNIDRSLRAGAHGTACLLAGLTIAGIVVVRLLAHMRSGADR